MWRPSAPRTTATSSPRRTAATRRRDTRGRRSSSRRSSGSAASTSPSRCCWPWSARVIVVWFFWAAFAKPKLVPRGAQNLGELGITFVRDQILRPMMGRRGDGFLPFLVSLFFFIWIMNLMEIIPVAQFPAMSFIAFPVVLMLMVYVTYTYLGHQAPGPGRLLRQHDPQGRALARSCSSWPRWRSSSTSSSGRSPWPSGCSPTCSPGTSCCWCSRWPPGTCSAPADRPAVQRHLVHPDRGADRFRDADPGPAGLHLHDPDRPVHRRFAGSGPLTMARRPQTASEPRWHDRKGSHTCLKPCTPCG